MNDRIIDSIEQLHYMLEAAIQLEHATIPPYLTALYSIYPNTNLEAVATIRAVLVEEMLHLTLAANVLNSVGKKPDLTKRGFVPNFPTFLPDGETDFKVSIAPFSPETLETFLNIERPSKMSDTGPRSNFCKGCIPCSNVDKFELSAITPHQGHNYRFYSIGEFYDAILEGIEFLEAEAKASGSTIFVGSSHLQVSNAYYYSGGGEVIEVNDVDTARKALELIKEQGEGHGGSIFNSEGEISHYYRFEQLKMGQYYQVGDQPGQPTGERFSVNFEKVYPIKSNPKLSDYPLESELYRAARLFNQNYLKFLALVTEAFNGNQNVLLGAVCDMFRLKEGATQLIRNPIPNQSHINGAPTFELYNVSQELSQVQIDVQEALS
ncbi:hypothetical protein GCM10007938_14570 [Vibrio zhanjiangensis]|uniref:Iminophenyl-pyruvate dimer synthase domain-containing protein n=1 Tax=Vibrio zhanjiangensis TaxID=1046128 RepID=A0ABQ6EXI2_9VIBR|nr:ferritin-like protein [Vibrio zhanjiangensis]GLT17679.1 hypothetical protein GCM10007938_14570 [Vibrio zhanjiangensis]